MHIDRSKDLTRRALLGRAAALGGMGVAAPLAMNLASFGEAAAFNATDYKAIVCIFLYGGNDHANTVVPYDATNHALYSAIRGSIAYDRADLAATALTPTGQTLPHGLQYALSPSLPGLKALFDQGRLGVQLNVGPLITPLTAAQYDHPNRSLYPLPPKLFSHNDQQSVWQALGSEGAT
ncbi:MAG: Tat pathway signal protein, partial [Asticcacaulis sp. 32-58-5]